jgi:hypothetical protein
MVHSDVWIASRDEIRETPITEIDTEKCMVSILGGLFDLSPEYERVVMLFLSPGVASASLSSILVQAVLFDQAIPFIKDLNMIFIKLENPPDDTVLLLGSPVSSGPLSACKCVDAPIS